MRPSFLNLLLLVFAAAPLAAAPLCPAVLAQGASPAVAPQSLSLDQALQQALTGRWTGVLEYRDYSEPAGSTKRVQLPTWLTIVSGAEGLRFVYTYDDGPNKVLEEQETVVFDFAAKTYKAMENGHAWATYAVAGLDALKDGRGELVMTGPGTENDKPAEMRVTWTIRRNLLSILEETRPAGSAEAFAFRHRYVFTRAEAPSVTAAR
jgi:hypothetical protein